MTSFHYYDQNLSGLCFLVQIKAFVIQTSLGLPNLNIKGKTTRILVVVIKWRHCANGLLECQQIWGLTFRIKVWDSATTIFAFTRIHLFYPPPPPPPPKKFCTWPLFPISRGYYSRPKRNKKTMVMKKKGEESALWSMWKVCIGSQTFSSLDRSSRT